VANVIEKNIFPLFIQLEEKCEKLHDLFFDYDRKIEFRENGNEHKLETKEKITELVLEKWLINKTVQEEKLKKEINYSYDLKGLKKTIKGYDVYFSVKIFFKDYTFFIKDNFNNQYEFPYDKILSEDEIKNIITPIITELIERIKQYA
jgi:hypothetical protein